MDDTEAVRLSQAINSGDRRRADRKALERSRTSEAEARKQTRIVKAKSKEVQQQYRVVAEAIQLAKQHEKLARKQRDLALSSLYVAHLKLAQQDWRVGNLPRMVRTLDAYRPHRDLPELRGWEWYYLASLAQRNKNVFNPQLGPVSKVAWSPDDRLIAIGGGRGLKIHEPVSQHVVHAWSALAGHPPFAWSPDGSRDHVSLRVAKIAQSRSGKRPADVNSWHSTAMTIP